MWTFTVLALVLSVASSHASDDSEKNPEGKYVLVTGGASGIGYSIADKFLENGASLMVIVDKNEELGEKAAQTLIEKYGDIVYFIQGDVTTDLNKVDDIVMANWGNPDVLVNNAGVNNPYSAEETINTNLLAPIRWSMRMFNDTRKDRGGKGSTIMNIGSEHGYTMAPMTPFYTAGSCGISGFTSSLGHEYIYRSSGVRAFTLALGLTWTEMTSKQLTTDEYATAMYAIEQNREWQCANDVGEAAVEVFKMANSGESYTVLGGKVFKSPDRVYVSAEEIDEMISKCDSSTK